MKIYHISKYHGKTKRDSGNKILYHVSPERLTQFSPRSKMNGQAGIFLSPTYRSAIEDWGPYVANKKSKNHPFEDAWGNLLDEYGELENEWLEEKDEEKKEELKKRYLKMKERVDSFRETLNSKSYQDSQKPYNTLYIHKVSVPRNIIKAGNEFMENAYNEGYANNSFAFWAWGEQIFFPENLLPELEIVGVKEINWGEFQNEYHQLMNKRQRYSPENSKGDNS
jgi:hypothetical protein